MVAPAIGAPPGLTVTVPVTVPPAPAGVQPENGPNEPNFVSQRWLKVWSAGFAYSLVYQNVQPSGSSVIALQSPQRVVPVCEAVPVKKVCSVRLKVLTGSAARRPA